MRSKHHASFTPSATWVQEECQLLLSAKAPDASALGATKLHLIGEKDKMRSTAIRIECLLFCLSRHDAFDYASTELVCRPFPMGAQSAAVIGR